VTVIGPNTAFVLTVFGLLAIYGELVWPGYRVARIIGPGVIGLGMALTGSYFLWWYSPSPLGLECLGAAAALFLTDAFLNSYFAAGVAATAAMAIGFWKLFDSPPQIQAILAFPLSVVFGIVTSALNYSARIARRNKRVDIS
jgi:membrane-bound ClpP family serine protease